jgi:hypothetical protein
MNEDKHDPVATDIVGQPSNDVPSGTPRTLSPTAQAALFTLVNLLARQAVRDSLLKAANDNQGEN